MNSPALLKLRAHAIQVLQILGSQSKTRSAVRALHNQIRCGTLWKGCRTQPKAKKRPHKENSPVRPSVFT